MHRHNRFTFLKSRDKIDARRLAELLRLNHVNPNYHGKHGLRSLNELVRSLLHLIRCHWQSVGRRRLMSPKRSEVYPMFL